MSMEAGTRLGPYEIVSQLAAGGMGEVYKARDTRLDRTVAVKILPPHLSASLDLRQRFEREARAVSSLNHPHICALYDIGDQNGTHYLVMEYLEGETLRSALKGGSLPSRKVLDLGIQIANALGAAHEKGIVHRDLKPENIFLTREDRVKLLDFGLAHEEGPLVPSDDSLTPTRTQMTSPGTVIGTVGYMSPEQVRGMAVDARSDIFSFGSVLYEMLAGERAFQRPTQAETIAAILKEDPPEMDLLGKAIPPALIRIVQRCVEKKPETRFRSAQDLAFALEMSGSTISPARTQAAVQEPRRGFLRSGIFILLIGALLVAAFYWGGRNKERPAVPSFRQLTFRRGTVFSARFAPDGQTIVYGAAFGGQGVELFSTRADSSESRSLGIKADILGISQKGEMGVLLNRRYLGSWITAGTLAKVPLAGGTPREILENIHDGDISPDGDQFAIVRRVGTRQRLEYPIGKVLFETLGWISDPRISPDGKQVAFAEHPLYADDRGFVTLVSEGGTAKRMTEEWSSVRGVNWKPDGREIWFNAVKTGEDSSIFAVEMDGKLKVVFRAPINLNVESMNPSGPVLLNSGERSVEIAGLLAGDTQERDLSLYGDEAISGLSEDGAVLAATQTSAGAGLNYQVYIRRADGTGAVLLGEGNTLGISPDGKWVLSDLPSGNRDEFTLYPTGPGEPQKISLGKIREELGVTSASWSSNGKRLVFIGSEPGQDLKAYLLDLPAKTVRAISPPGMQFALISADGESVAVLGADGTAAIYPVRGGAGMPVRGLLAGEIPIQWDHSGSFLFVWDRSFPARIYRLELTTGKRELWKETEPPAPIGIAYGNMLMTRDGKHYVYRYRRLLDRLYVAEGLQ